ncbi:MAG: TonB family protein [Deltaproteobacteria bacterium]|nr:MAG: TonB family protein [Deltaproteobacteria bacterium]
MRCPIRLVAAAVAAAVVAGAGTAARAQQEGVRRDEVEPPPAREPELTKPPELLEAVAPEYPPEELAAGREAAVTVRIDIDATGRVTRVEVVDGAGPAFDAAAVAAARRYRFSPAEFDGVPGPITVETTIRFTIERQPEPEPAAAPPAAPVPAAESGPPGHAGDPGAPVSIHGVALERGTRRRLAGVIVSVVEAGIDAVTDERGEFFVHGLPAGRYTLVASDDAFDRFTRTIDLAARERIDVKLYLRPKGGNPYETVVEGESQAFEVTKRTLRRRQMTTVPGTFGDPIRVVQTLPGLARTPFVTGFLLIRGSTPGDSGVYVDGHQVPLLFHFLGGPSFLNPEFLDELSLYPGGFPARFGRAQGGIVAVETRPPKSDGWHGSADVDLLDAGAYLRAPLGEHSGLAIAGRRSYLNLLLPAFLPEPDAGDTLIVTPVYQDYNIRYDRDFGARGSASLFVFGSRDDLDVLSTDADAEESFALDSSVHFFRIIATYRRPIAGGLTLTLSPAWGRDSVRFAGAQTDPADPTTAVDISQQALSYRMRIHGDLSARMRLDTGLDIASRVTRFELLVPVDDDFRDPVGGADIPSQVLENTIVGLGIGAYAELSADVGAGVRLIPGLRFDQYVLAGQPRVSVDPRIVARWTVADPWTVKAYAGLFSQPPQPERFDVRFGNPDLELERAIHTGAGAEYRLGKTWSFDAEAYYIDRRNQAVFTDAVERLPDGTLRPLRSVNTGRGFTYGLELLVRRNITRNAYGWLSYTLSFTKARSDDDDDFDYTFADQRHNLNAVYSYTTDGGWELGARYRLSSGTPTTPIVGATFDADTGSYRPVRGEFRSAREPTFHQLDVRAEKTWLYDTWSFGVYLDVLNVLNIENVEATQYDYRYRDSAPITSVPFVPTLGIRGRF